MSPPVRISRNAWDMVGQSNSRLNNHAFNNRQTVHPIRGPQLQRPFTPLVAAVASVQMAQTPANIAPGATATVDLVDITKTPTGGTVDATNVTTQTLIGQSYLYVITEPSGGRTLYPLELARCNLTQPQPTITA